MAYPRRQEAKQHGTIAVTATSQILIPENHARLSLLIKNDGAADIFIKLRTQARVDPTATADGASLKIAVGQTYSTTDYTGPVAVRTSAGTSAPTVLEF